MVEGAVCFCLAGQAAVKALRQLGYSGGGAASKAAAAHGEHGRQAARAGDRVKLAPGQRAMLNFHDL